MADEPNSASDRGDDGSPFSRPGFLVAAVLVVIVVVLAAFIAIRVARGNDKTAPLRVSTSPNTPSAVATPSAAAAPGASVCGLPAPAGADRPLTSAPAATWDYEGATAYPKSAEFGPGRTAPKGYRYCFQHSPAGAVFATANALAVPQATDAQRAWIEYFVSSGPNRQRLLDTMEAEPSAAPTGVRMQIVGFKVLSYTNSRARVDIAVEASSNARTVMGSYVYELIWQAGDWKLNSGAPTPFNFSTIPTAAGYVPWNG